MTDWLELQKIEVLPATYDKYSIYVHSHFIPFLKTEISNS
ncbi:MAG: hypothetical protein GX351_04615 [Peptococcaceae bacterium]|nr:hypothetical protein [Peptococcaceae bacterium]